MKLSTLIIGLAVLFTALCLWLTTMAVKEVQTIGLKTIVEQIWYGKTQKK